jgi:hypothetical protein
MLQMGFSVGSQRRSERRSLLSSPRVALGNCTAGAFKLSGAAPRPAFAHRRRPTEVAPPRSRAVGSGRRPHHGSVQPPPAAAALALAPGPQTNWRRLRSRARKSLFAIARRARRRQRPKATTISAAVAPPRPSLSPGPTHPWRRLHLAPGRPRPATAPGALATAPQATAQLSLDAPPPSTSRAYRFTGHELTRWKEVEGRRLPTSTRRKAGAIQT